MLLDLLNSIDLRDVVAEFGRFSGAVLLIAGAIRWLLKHIDKLDRENRAAAAKAQEQCLAREGEIARRLRSVEDRQHDESRQLLDRSARALEMNASAMKSFAEGSSGYWKALRGNEGDSPPGRR